VGLCVLIPGAVASVSRAQLEAHQPAAVATAADNIGEQPPSPAETMRAYKRAESLVRTWNVESELMPGGAATMESQPQPVAAGACIVLRYQGEILGRGVAQAFWGSIGPAATDDPRRRVTDLATALAIAQADPGLPVGNDLMREAAVQHLTPDILISCELAGRLRPVLTDTWTELDLNLNPGLDGLAVHIGKPGEEAQDLAVGRTKIIFPSEMMTKNALPQTIIRGLIADALGEGGATKLLLSPKELRDKEAVRIWTFQVSHQAQAKPRSEPIFLYRGAAVIAASEMTIGELREMADRLATNLANRADSDDSRTPDLSIYQPWSNQFERTGDGASPLILAVVSLSRYQNWSDPPRAVPTPNKADTAINNFFQRAQVQKVQPKSAIDWMFYLLDGRLGDPTKNLNLKRIRAANVLNLCADYAANGKSIDGLESAEATREIIDLIRFDKLNLTEQAVFSYVLSRPSDPNGQGQVFQLSRLLRTTFAACPPGQLVSLMPWLGWAEVRAADSRGRDPGTNPLPPELAPGRDIPSAIALREMRSQCWKHHLNFTDITDESYDFLGGIVFTQTNGTKLPTWQSVRPIAFIATMLGDDRLTEPAERQQETFRLILALRFLRQLQVDESCGSLYPDPQKAIGGIRAATWDHSMPPDAASLTLMAVCEAIKSLEKLETENQAQQKQP